MSQHLLTEWFLTSTSGGSTLSSPKVDLAAESFHQGSVSANQTDIRMRESGRAIGPFVISDETWLISQYLLDLIRGHLTRKMVRHRCHHRLIGFVGGLQLSE